MVKKLLVVAALLSLVGCTQPDHWYKEGTSQAEFHRDNLACVATAKQIAGSLSVIGAPLYIALAQASHDQEMKAEYRECMLGKEYVLNNSQH